MLSEICQKQRKWAEKCTGVALEKQFKKAYPHTPGGGGYQDLALGGGLNLTDLQRLFGQGTSHVGPEYYASRR